MLFRSLQQDAFELVEVNAVLGGAGVDKADQHGQSLSGGVDGVEKSGVRCGLVASEQRAQVGKVLPRSSAGRRNHGFVALQAGHHLLDRAEAFKRQHNF